MSFIKNSLLLLNFLNCFSLPRSDRMGVTIEKGPPAPPADPVEYKYNMEYMTICQPVGPRLGTNFIFLFIFMHLAVYDFIY